jgi:hypothetical protein
MEFEELQKIWDEQNKQPHWIIDEKALHSRILSKKNRGRHITNVSEILLIGVNSAAGVLVLGLNISSRHPNIYMYVLASWMLCSALYMLMSRVRRLKEDGRFDRSMRGDLDHAISVAAYQVRLSRISRWNILPIAFLTMLGLWEGGKPAWIALPTVLFFLFAFYAGNWEQGIYKARKRELIELRHKLSSDN